MLREVAGEHVLLPLDQTGIGPLRVYQLTEEGAALWRALKNGADRAELVRLSQARGVAEASDSVEAFLDSLRELGLLAVG